MGNYVNNKQLYAELVQFREKVNLAKQGDKRRPQIPLYVAESIMHIAQNYARKPKFSGYSFVEDMVADGIMACIKYIDSFNPDKSENPFAYFTQVVHYAFINRLNVEQKQQYVKAVIVKQSGDTTDDENFNNDSLNTVITSFEGKIQRKKEKAAERNLIKEHDSEIEKEVETVDD